MEQAPAQGGGPVSELPENLAGYSAQHRTRERHEDGFVKLVGKREKKWEGSYHVYRLQPDGKEKRCRMTRIVGTKADIPTKAEALEQHRTWIRRQAAQPVADTARCKVAHLCDDYLALRQGNWEEATRKTNQSLFAQLVKPAIGNRAIASITAEDLVKLLNDLPHRKFTLSGKHRTGISDSYAKKVITHLRGIFDIALEKGLITKNPARSMVLQLKMPKQVRKADKTVFPPQYLPLLMAQLTVRDQLIVWLSILGATRPNELFAVRGADVGPGWVHIARALDRRRQLKSTKNSKARFIHLPPELADEVREWIAVEGIGPGDLLFPNRDGKPLNRANFLNRRLRPAAIRAKVPVADLDFQMLRRSFATVAQFVGLDVKAIQSQLGHSRPELTATVYMQAIDALTAGQLKRLEDMMRGREPIPVDVMAKLGTGVIQ
jgi:integrase